MEQQSGVRSEHLQPYWSQPVVTASADDVSPGFVTGFIILNILLAIIAKQHPILSTMYALATLGLGLLWLATDTTPQRVIYLTAYITGAELIWRGTDALVFSEFGKYAVSLLLILAILKFHLLKRSKIWPLFYFFLLIPSLFVMPSFNRYDISFHLSGPLTLAVTSMFFSAQELKRSDLKRIMLAITAPAAGLGFLALFFTLSAETIEFTGSSLHATSAAIGPNQMSSILGYGALTSFMYIFLEKRRRGVRLLMVGLSIWLLAQSMLTFSRGGFWTALGGMLVAGFYLVRDRSTRGILLAACITLAAGYYFFFPLVDSFTGGTLSQRFTSTDLTRRDVIMKIDLRIFTDQPLFGVGPGGSTIYHAVAMGRKAIAHVEYTRLLAEHGVFGLLALLILLGASIVTVLSRASPDQKGYRIPWISWTLVFLFHSATRNVAPMFTFGLAQAELILEEEEADG